MVVVVVVVLLPESLLPPITSVVLSGHATASCTCSVVLLVIGCSNNR